MSNETKHSPTPWKVNDYMWGGARKGHQKKIHAQDGSWIVNCRCRSNVFGLPNDELANANAAFIVECANQHEQLRDLVSRLLPLAMAAGAKDGKLKPIAGACFKEATELLGNIVEVKDGK